MVYIGSGCSLLVVDRGNKAIREIQLHFDDCAYQYGTGFPLGRVSIIVMFVSSFVNVIRHLLTQSSHATMSFSV